MRDMPTQTVTDQSASFVKPRPEIRPGFTVRVHEKIKEGGKERIQVFEGLVISVHKGKVPTDHTFTVRRIVSGVGVERIFPLYSPQLAKIEVKKVAKVRRAKLFFLRGRHGKAARLSERFTTAEEFAIAAAQEDDKEEVVEEEVVEKATEESKDAKESKDNESSDSSASLSERSEEEEKKD